MPAASEVSVRRRPGGQGIPRGFVELLRLAVVVLAVGVGYEVGQTVGHGPHHLLGPLSGVWVGVLVGSGVGYVLGGVLGRTTVAAVVRAETSLGDVSVETLVAGALGTVGGVAVGAGVAWPLLLVPDRYVSVPLFGFILVTMAALGERISLTRRDAVVGLFGARAGLTPRPVPPSARPLLVDSSVAIDGRILDVVRAGFLHGRLLVPTPILDELQGLADAGDETRRERGRRGLATLEALRREPGVDVEVLDAAVPAVPEVDAKLVRLALDDGYGLLTLDTNLARAAGLAGVAVLNLHALALALRPPVLAGDEVLVRLLKAGKEPGQAVGYLDDGTMVVAERSRGSVGREVNVRVTSVLTTSNGRMVFAEPVTPGPGLAEPGPAVGAGGPPAAALPPGPPATPAALATRLPSLAPTPAPSPARTPVPPGGRAESGPSKAEPDQVTPPAPVAAPGTRRPVPGPPVRPPVRR